jgi:hypothetical protein
MACVRVKARLQAKLAVQRSFTRGRQQAELVSTNITITASRHVWGAFIAFHLGTLSIEHNHQDLKPRRLFDPPRQVCRQRV